MNKRRLRKRTCNEKDAIDIVQEFAEYSRYPWKKIAAFGALIVLGVLVWICSSAHAQTKLKVVTTIGQIKDAVDNIAGEFVDAQALMGPGVDPHLYRASESDVMRLASADIIFYNGLFLEAKMGQIFEKMAGTRKTVAVSQGAPTSDLLEDVQFAGHYDPHIWFDVPLWMKTVERVATELAASDSQNAPVYAQNAKTYLQQLDELHQYVARRCQEVPEHQRVLVTAHDAFRYFGRRYGFEVLGLQGLSTESEAAAADVKRLADIIVERKIKAIFVESSVPERNIKAVQQAVKSRGWDVRIGGELFSDAMGSDGTPEGTYVGMVKHNVDTIVDALK